MEHKDIYLLCLLAAALCGSGLYVFLANRAGYRARALWLPPLLAIGFGLLCARLFHFTALTDFQLPGYGWSSFFDIGIKDQAFGGALIGLLLSGLVSAGLLKKRVHQMLDLMAPAGLLTLGLARLGEYFVEFGQGSYVENPSLQFFPLSVRNIWDEWYFAVFMLEALFALAALLYAFRKRRAVPSALWQTSLIVILCSQILCESLRAETLRWGFVRVHQVFCALGLAALLVHFVRLAKREGRHVGRLLFFFALFALGIALVMGIEYSLDKWQEMPHWALYSLMALTLLGLGYTLEKLRRLGVPAGGAPG